MSFAIEQMTKAKILDVEVLSQKNREPDEEPGAKLRLSVKLANDVLAGFDGLLTSFLFTRNATAVPIKQGTLDGVEVVSDLPHLSGIGSHVKTLKWESELTGYQLEIDHGTGGRSNLLIDDCMLSSFRMQPQEGGTVLIKFNCESSNVAGALWAKLAKLKSREVDIILTAPEIAQQELEDEGERAPLASIKPSRKKDPTSAFVAAHSAPN